MYFAFKSFEIDFSQVNPSCSDKFFFKGAFPICTELTLGELCCQHIDFFMGQICPADLCIHSRSMDKSFPQTLGDFWKRRTQSYLLFGTFFFEFLKGLDCESQLTCT